MKINFTKKEYSLLLDMLYLSDWMIHAFEEGMSNNDYKTLRKKILSHYKEMSAENKIEYSSEFGDYYELDSYDTEMHEKFISPYENNFFWDELIDRLGRRDFIDAIGIDAYEALPPIERAEGSYKEQNKYRKAFEESGLQNLKMLTEPKH